MLLLRLRRPTMRPIVRPRRPAPLDSAWRVAGRCAADGVAVPPCGASPRLFGAVTATGRPVFVTLAVGSLAALRGVPLVAAAAFVADTLVGSPMGIRRGGTLSFPSVGAQGRDWCLVLNSGCLARRRQHLDRGGLNANVQIFLLFFHCGHRNC